MDEEEPLRTLPCRAIGLPARITHIDRCSQPVLPLQSVSPEQDPSWSLPFRYITTAQHRRRGTLQESKTLVASRRVNHRLIGDSSPLGSIPYKNGLMLLVNYHLTVEKRLCDGRKRSSGLVTSEGTSQ